MEDRYDENYNTLKKEIEDIRRWKIYNIFGTVESNHQIMHITENNLQIQLNHNQNPNNILVRNRKDDSRIHLKNTRDHE